LPTEVRQKQCDQIGPIFASLAIAYVFWATFFPQKKLCINFDKNNRLGYILGGFFSQTHLVTLARNQKSLPVQVQSRRRASKMVNTAQWSLRKFSAKITDRFNLGTQNLTMFVLKWSSGFKTDSLK
jgi:hypothetical protein